MRKSNFLLITLLITAMLTACNGGSGGGGGSSDDGNTQNTPAPTPTPFDTSKTTQIDVFNTTPSTVPKATKYSAFDSDFSDRADGDILTLKGLAAFGSQHNTYTRETAATAWDDNDNLRIDSKITLSRITAPAINLTFDSTGEISTVTAYLDELDADMLANLTINAERFDFASSGRSEYTAYIDWKSEKAATLETELIDTGYNINGLMVAGVESHFAYLLFPTKQSNIMFNGSGKGIYGVGMTEYNTAFTATATVDFTAKNILLSTDTTCTDTSCDGITASALNFTELSLSFATGNNSISKTDVTLDNTLTGTLDARFYGPNGWELGGTFALAEANNRYYYGAFAANRQGITTPLAFSEDSLTVTPPTEWATDTTATSNSGESLSTLSMAGGKATMNALAVAGSHVQKYQRSPNRGWTAADNANHYGDSQHTISLTRLLGASTSISFANTGDGAISEIEINFTLDNFMVTEFDTTTDLSATKTTNNTDNPDNPNNFSLFDDADSTKLTVDRSIFGFDSNYMVYVTATADRAGDYTTANQSTKEYNFDYDTILLAGIETKTSDFTQLFGVVDFTGKGRGIKGDDTGNYATIFDVNVAVNFGSNSLVVTSHKTCKAAATAVCNDADLGTSTPIGADRDDSLNVTTAALSFADALDNKLISNTASGNVTAGNGLSGTADVRFYGAIGAELGGTFALTNSTTNSYYYGAFGTNRQGIVTDYTALASFPELTAADKPDVLVQNTAATPVDYISLSAASADTSNAINKSYTLSGLAVYGRIDNNYTRADIATPWDTVDYSQTATGNTIKENAALSLNFIADGTISGVTAYLKYGTVDTQHDSGIAIGTPTATNFNAPIGTSTTTSISASRGSDFFGFESNYMVYLNWTINQDSLGAATTANTYNIEGMMVAGMRMNGDLDSPPASNTDNIRTNGNATFIGKGRGIYGDDASRYATVFDVLVTVDFGASENRNNTLINTENTRKADDETQKLPALDLARGTTYMLALDNYKYGGTLTATNHGGLKGNIYARLYGEYGWEFGGTFALYGEPDGDNRYYYGAFGAQRNGVSDALAFNNTGINTPIAAATGFTINADSLATISPTPDTTLSMNALAAALDDTSHYQRTQNMEWTATNDQSDNQRSITSARITDSALSISFDAQGNISGVTAYADKAYTATIDSPISATSFTATNTDGVTLNLELGAGLNSRFGFDSQYMAYADWQATSAGDFATENDSHLTQTTYNRDGIMLAGIENADLINLAGDTSFTGKGSGYYDENDSVRKDYAIDTSYATIFDVALAVNFAGKTMALTIDGTCRADDATCATPLTALDFGTIAIAIPEIANHSITNNLVNDVTLGDLTGKLDTRFYSAEAREFGGTFALTSSTETGNSFYHGAFGANRTDYIIATTTQTTSHADFDLQTLPFNDSTLTSFTDPNRIDKQNDALQIATAVRITKGNNGEFTKDTIITEKISGGLAVLDYDNLGAFNIDFGNSKNFILYIADNKYILNAGSDGASAVSGNGVQVTGAAALSLARNEFGLANGDDAEYMASIAWEENADTSYGYAVVGFETDGTILTNLGSGGQADSTEFNGKGGGYYTEINTTDNDVAVSFDMTANVDFANKAIIITSNNSCTNIYACGDTPIAHLDFTGTLNYAENQNNVFGSLTSKGADLDFENNADKTALSGTADARFYGIGAQEFGGTFALQNNSAGYAGWFGAGRGNLVFEQAVNTSTTVGNSLEINNPNPVYDLGSASNRKGKMNNLFNMQTVQLINDTHNATLTSVRVNDGKFEISHVNNINAHIVYHYNNTNTNVPKPINTPVMYFGDKKYDLGTKLGEDLSGSHTGIGTNNRRGDAIIDFVNDVAFSNSAFVLFSRDTFDVGVTSKYLFVTQWEINEPVDGKAVDTHGYGIWGIETSDASTGGVIPITGNVTFLGVGRGQYNTTNGVDSGERFFNVSSEIDFANKTITVTSIKTCIVRENNCSAGTPSDPSNQRYHLDFKGTLSYGVDEATNKPTSHATGTFTTKGTDGSFTDNSDGTALLGNAEARFYGPGVTSGTDKQISDNLDVGGTFKMQNADAAYIGYFTGICKGVEYAFNDKVVTCD